MSSYNYNKLNLKRNDREITSKRTYNQKVFEVGDNKKRYIIHSGHIHYKDERGDFKDSDFHLRKTDTGWVMDKHNYNMFIPDYADEWFDFYNGYEGANHHIKMKPIANHVLGVENHDEKYVLYKDAFGKGIDLKARIRRRGILKETIINENPNKDIHFDFEIELDEKSRDVRRGLIDTKRITPSITKLDLTNKSFRFGDKKASYVKSAYVWDSSELSKKREPVKLELFKKNNKTYLRKTITKEFFDKATFPVYTDHPTDYYGSTSDGEVLNHDYFGWEDTRSASTGTSTDDSATYMNVYSIDAGTPTDIYRGFLYIDTSGIDDGATIDSATLYLRSLYSDNGGPVSAQKGIQAATLTTADYDSFVGTTGDNDPDGRSYGHADIGTGAHYGISFNATGISDIDKTGTTKICLREYDYDYSDVDIQGNGYSGALPYTADDASHEPYLDITASAGVTEKEVTDTVTGSEAGEIYRNQQTVSILASLTQSDSLTGSDIATILASITQTDSGSFTEELLGNFTKLISDTGTLESSLTILNSLTIEDSDTLSDTISVLASLVESDTVSSNETLELLAKISQIDSSTASDLIAVLAKLSIEDVGTFGVDTIIVSWFIKVLSITISEYLTQTRTISEYIIQTQTTSEYISQTITTEDSSN
jgi:hypothetical protein